MVMSFLNRTDELEVPSCPFESITTGVAPPTGVTPKMLPIKQLLLTGAPGPPITMTLLAPVTNLPAFAPNAMLPLPPDW